MRPPHRHRPLADSARSNLVRRQDPQTATCPIFKGCLPGLT
jgi:hypothetical protein